MLIEKNSYFLAKKHIKKSENTVNFTLSLNKIEQNKFIFCKKRTTTNIKIQGTNMGLLKGVILEK